MAVVLDPPVHCNGLAIAALARVMILPIAGPQGLSVLGHKQPLAVLLHDGTTMQGFDIAGHPLSPTEVDSLLPGAAGTLEKAWRGRNIPA